jgi:hypothetical protein
MPSDEGRNTNRPALTRGAMASVAGFRGCSVPRSSSLVRARALLALTLAVARCGLADDSRGHPRPGNGDADVGMGMCQRDGRCCDCSRGRVKLLHVTRHAGLQMEVQATVRHLCCIDVQTFAFDDGVNLDGEEAGLNYNVHSARAQAAWDAHGQWFQTFDAVLVSDVTAMARPFLQQPLFTKPLFLWVCNRFDFANQDHEFVLAHTDMLQHGYFPDAQYYPLMQAAASTPNVSILLSNGFEGHYALHWRGVDWSSAPLLYPAGLGGRPSLRACSAGANGLGDVTPERGPGEDEEREEEQLLQVPGLYGGHSLESFPPAQSLPDTVRCAPASRFLFIVPFLAFRRPSPIHKLAARTTAN